MQLKLYSTVDDLNVINKTLTLVAEITVRLPREIDVSNFDLVIKGDVELDLELVNYAELVDINRKYFVERCVNLGGQLWRLTLDCDVLETYRIDILSSLGKVKRGLKTGDYVSDQLLAEDRKTITQVFSDKELLPDTNLIITTIGG